MEHHASAESFIGCFAKLIENTRDSVFYCAEDPIAVTLCSGNPKCVPFNCSSPPIPIPLPGKHNQWNAAAALAVARLWKPKNEIYCAFEKLRPLRRRFETVFNNNEIRMISDYAHHPTEIAALIQTAQELQPQRLLGIFQPHRYTRTRALGDDFPASFDGLDQLWLVPVYAASEQEIEGGTTEHLAAKFPDSWKSRLHRFQSLEEAWIDIQAELTAGDLLLIIGAGDIEQLAEQAREWCPGEGSNLRPTD
ncbi:MAG: hypothetical protein HKP10_06150 [Kiritimatiellales bacterium]|nr:hypothetical protein [Kiritimatiellales bacterium]